MRLSVGKRPARTSFGQQLPTTCGCRITTSSSTSLMPSSLMLPSWVLSFLSCEPLRGRSRSLVCDFSPCRPCRQVRFSQSLFCSGAFPSPRRFLSFSNSDAWRLSSLSWPWGFLGSVPLPFETHGLDQSSSAEEQRRFAGGARHLLLHWLRSVRSGRDNAAHRAGAMHHPSDQGELDPRGYSECR